MRWSRLKTCSLCLAFAVSYIGFAPICRAGEEASALEFRRVDEGKVAEEGTPIPRRAVRVFVYEGAAKSLGVDNRHIAVVFDRSGCLFDRKTGELTRRSTVADGPPEEWTGFPSTQPPEEVPPGPIGPGVVEPGGAKEGEAAARVVAASIEFRGETWSAIQPQWSLRGRGTRTGSFKGWTEILEDLNRGSYVETGGGAARPPRRYTTSDGLASNIVSGFAVFENTLYAVCADIYEQQKGGWGPGGLCRYNRTRDRWTRAEIDGRPVRFVTMLDTIGDELWVGFREGTGVEGDELFYGMGVHLREYGPEMTAVTLARLKDGEWTVWSRPPYDPSHGSVSRSRERPTERPVRILRGDDDVFLYSAIRLSGPYRPGGYRQGFISRLDLDTAEWTTWDPEKVFGARWLWDLVEMNGEILVTSDRGVHQYDRANNTWRFLDPGCTLKSPVFGPIQLVGEEVWFAYGDADPGVRSEEGIIRYNEGTGEWTRMLLKDLGSKLPPKKMFLWRGGDLWVVFHPHHAPPSAMSIWAYSIMPWRLSTVGRFSSGEWEYPVPLEGVPTRSGRRRQPKPTDSYRIKEFFVLGDHLYLCTGHGVYEGPDPWREIFSVPGPEDDSDQYYFPLSIAVSEDVKELIITWRDQETFKKDRTFKRAVYSRGDANIEFETITEKPAPPQPKEPDPAAKKAAEFQNRWAPVSVKDGSEWVIGSFDGYRKVLETPWAVWLITGGELIRLDRTALAEWLGLPEDAD